VFASSFWANFMLVPEELIMVSSNTKSADKDTRRSYMGTSNEFTTPPEEDSRNQGFKLLIYLHSFIEDPGTLFLIYGLRFCRYKFFYETGGPLRVHCVFYCISRCLHSELCTSEGGNIRIRFSKRTLITIMHHL